MNYCCTELKEQVIRREHGSVIFSHVILWNRIGPYQYDAVEMRFCPFCGSDLVPRFEVHPPKSRMWLVYDTVLQKTVAHFDNKEAAEEHIQKIDKCK